LLAMTLTLASSDSAQSVKTNEKKIHGVMNISVCHVDSLKSNIILTGTGVSEKNYALEYSLGQL
jgi:hypothetical protein